MVSIEEQVTVKNIKKEFLAVCMYVDDLIYFGTNKTMVKEFKIKITKDFEIVHLEFMKYFLSIQVKQSLRRFFLYQEKYIEDLLNEIQHEPV